jgi:hypothetical protein
MQEYADILKRRAERICSLILFSELPWIDILIEIQALREWLATVDPERLWLFDLIYKSRFERLWEQWRLEFPE